MSVVVHVCNCNVKVNPTIFMVRFPVQDIKGHMMDIRTADGSIVKISTAGNGDQELTKTLGVEMVQNMYKVQEMLVQKRVVQLFNTNFQCSLYHASRYMTRVTAG